MLLRRVCCWLWTLSVLAAATNAVLVDKLSHAISNAGELLPPSSIVPR
jgi:hypothetical protein